MTNLQRYDNGEIELFIDQITGESFASISGTARMCGRNESTIRSRITSRNLNLKMAEVYTPNGFRSSRLVPESLISELVFEFNPELAKQMMQAGTRVYLYGLAGYKVKAVDQSNNHATLPLILAEMKGLRQEVKTLAQFKSYTDAELPGVSILFEAIVGHLMITDGEMITLRDWLESQDIELTRSELGRFSSRVAYVYRALTGKEPMKKGITNLYPSTASQLFEMCYCYFN